jgi:hypothetical protein
MRRIALPSILLVFFGITLVILAGLYNPGGGPYDPTWTALSLFAGLILIGMAVCLLRSGK